jgi:hypothetical protein
VPVSIHELTKADDACRAELLTRAAGTLAALANLRDWRRRFRWNGSNLAQHPGWRMELDRVKSLAYVACPC